MGAGSIPAASTRAAALAAAGLVIWPGALFQGSERDFYAERNAMHALLRELQAPLGVFIGGHLPEHLESARCGREIPDDEGREARG